MTTPPFDKVIEMLKKSASPESDILRSSAYWFPLQFVYVAMAKNGDIKRLSELPKERKLFYWRQVNHKWPQFKKISVCQALYVWDEIKAEIKYETD
jgi:hypothetical protein